jgi:hypothetical protein
MFFGPEQKAPRAHGLGSASDADHGLLQALAALSFQNIPQNIFRQGC